MTISNTEIAAQIVDLIDKWNNREDELVAWLAGTATGGPNNNGLYPLTNELGVTYMVACPAKMVQVTQKGDKGDDAKVDLIIQAQFAVGASEPLPPIIAAAAITFTPASCKAWAKGAPSGSAVTMTATKNGAAWMSCTWAAGSQTGTVSFTGSPSLAVGDIVEPYGPATFNSAFQSPTITLAGA
ncbi:hypothetical protein CPT_Seuss32 [Caulobacter phage Seuss]|uniref:Uncharacterized protein n=1 Tax=Caulobacter phage Seuss TaxID=1675601 RepID=A0A0K1LMY1_9CAUD|nr:hypothetical protein HOR08_gp032 [Caulobacter phage Seuss]AKU43558.1 hypothetical protein CPT_Seuss32 [Caulobacter phage Seuss]